MKRILPWLVLPLLAMASPALAQSSVRVQAQAVATCGTQSYTAGTFYPATQDLTGTLCVTSSGGGGGGLSVTDRAAWTQGSSAFTPTGGVYNDTATLSSGQEGTLRLTTKRAAIVDTDTSGSALYTAITSPPPLNINGVNQAWTGVTPGVAQTGTKYAGNVDVASILGTAAAVNSGNKDAGTLRVVLATDQPSLSNAQPANIVAYGGSAVSNTNPLFNSPVPTTAGGLSVYFVQPTASDNHANIKNGAGQVYKISVTNNSATVNYIRLYNAASGFNGCNSATNLVYQMAVPASTSGNGYSDSWELGMAFSTGISICVTSGYATNDTTNATASAMSVNVGYK